VAASEYHHGDMDIGEQRRTFHGFVRMTVWSCGLLAVTLVFLTLHFTFVGLGWFPSLAVAFALGVVIGLGLGMKGTWYAVLVGLTVLMALVGGFAALIGAFLR
jgi:hypothetical protein